MYRVQLNTIINLRSIPIAALYDGKQFLIEKYSVGIIPSFSLTDTRYIPIINSDILAMGISQSTEDPKVEMLVLSACKTAVCNPQAELGFSGLALQAGVKSVLGSLWYVSMLVMKNL